MALLGRAQLPLPSPTKPGGKAALHEDQLRLAFILRSPVYYRGARDQAVGRGQDPLQARLHPNVKSGDRTMQNSLCLWAEQRPITHLRAENREGEGEGVWLLSALSRVRSFALSSSVGKGRAKR